MTTAEQRAAVDEVARRVDAAHRLAALDASVWLDQAHAFTCIEADTIAAFLAAYHDDRTAQTFIDAHAEGDDEGDDHFREPA